MRLERERLIPLLLVANRFRKATVWACLGFLHQKSYETPVTRQIMLFGTRELLCSGSRSISEISEETPTM